MQITLPETLDGLRDLRARIDVAIAAMEALTDGEPQDDAEHEPTASEA